MAWSRVRREGAELKHKHKMHRTATREARNLHSAVLYYHLPQTQYIFCLSDTLTAYTTTLAETLLEEARRHRTEQHSLAEGSLLLPAHQRRRLVSGPFPLLPWPQMRCNGACGCEDLIPHPGN